MGASLQKCPCFLRAECTSDDCGAENSPGNCNREDTENGFTYYRHSVIDTRSWHALPAVAELPCKRRCRCHFLVGHRQEEGPRAAIVLLAPIEEEVDLAVVACWLGLRKGLVHGPDDFLGSSMGCTREFLTPLSALITDANVRVAVAASLSSESLLDDRIALRSSPLVTLICSLSALISKLKHRGDIQVDVAVPSSW